MKRISRRNFGRDIVATSLAARTVGWHGACGAQGPDRIRVGQIGTRHAHASGKIATMRKLDELFERDAERAGAS